jgi:hypothetical protein
LTWRCLHTADWQIGKPFRNFEDRIAGVLDDARLTAIDRVAAAAREGGARHILVAGDVYDAEVVSERTLRQPIERMRAHADVVWHLLPGNHDPIRAGSLWHRLADLGLPQGIRAHLTPSPVELEPGVVLLPAPLTSRATSIDPTTYMDAVSTPDGTLRIGFAHGSIASFSQDGEAATPIAADRAKRAGLDYLALGDWHGTVEINPQTWYSGTPEPDRFRTTNAGQALLVEVPGRRAAPMVRATRTGRFHWTEIEAAVLSANDFERLERGLAPAGYALDQVLARMVLSGRVSLDVVLAAEAWGGDLAARLKFFEADLSGLTIDADGANLDLFGQDGPLRQTADRIARILHDADLPRRAAAAGALARLLALSRETGREPAP